MHIDPWTLLLQTLNVLVLVGLLGRFLYRPVMKVIADRQAAADALLEDAAATKAGAEAELAGLRAKNAELAADAERLHAAARAAADGERQRLLERARAEAATLASQAQAATAAERARIARALEDQAGQLAAGMAEKLLGRLDPQAVMPAMTVVLLDRLRALTDQERHRLAKEAPLMVVTATPLTPDQQARVASELAEVLPDLTDPAFAVEPALIAGVELRAPHSALRNSWRADLDALVAGMAREDDRGGQA